MDSEKFIENFCRICLEHRKIIDWNKKMFESCDISYKDCYYKYTKLEENDSDGFPTNICETCAVEVKSAHITFEKALQSFKFLQVAFATNEFESSECNDIEMCSSESNMNIIPVEQENRLFNVHDKDITIEETTHIDIKIFEYADTLLEQPLNKSFNNELTTLLTTKKMGTKRKNCESLVKTSKGQTCYKKEKCKSNPVSLFNQSVSENLNINLSVNENNDRRKENPISMASIDDKLSENFAVESIKPLENESFIESFSDEELSGSGDTTATKLMVTKVDNVREKQVSSCDTSLEQKISKYSNSKSPVSSTTKSRKNYKLMCAYCSLEVLGAEKLRIHESTHSENRKRTETCPECGLKLFTKLSLRGHMKIHDQHRQKKHKCEFCEKAFYNKGALNVHKRIHLGLMLKCPICSKECFRQTDLSRHLSKHSASPVMKNSDEKIKHVVECQYCNKSVLTAKWKEHKAVHMDQPQVKCTICEKNFFSRRRCSNHLRRFHHKNKSEYDNFIHYYTDRNDRLSLLLLKQQETVQTLKE